MPASLQAVLFGVTAATLSSFLIACRQTTTSAAEQPTVPTATARTANLTNELVLTAEFTPYQDVDVMAKVAGYVKNATNEKSVTDFYLTDDSSGLFRNVFFIEPRTYGVAVTKRF